MTDIAPLISTTDLAARLGDPALRVLDASWHLDGRDGRPDFEVERLSGAVFFDLEASSDQKSHLPHMLPSPDAFATRMGGLGIAVDDGIVVYDTVGIRSSARVWWMLRAMGARDVRVLDGGLPKWRAEGRPVDAGPQLGDALLGDVESDHARVLPRDREGDRKTHIAKPDDDNLLGGVHDVAAPAGGRPLRCASARMHS
jgi:3-mercaptopyruvate sulfurtransferase SseA